MTGYACAWKSGCNDDLQGMTRAAYIWTNGECYCWDAAANNWFPAACGSSIPEVCETAESADASSARPAGFATVNVSPIRSRSVAGASHVQVRITLRAQEHNSVAALELALPNRWQVTVINDGGVWDKEHGKVKWGPFFDDLSRTVTLMAKVPTGKTVKPGKLRGMVSFDGNTYPLVVGRQYRTPSRD